MSLLQGVADIIYASRSGCIVLVLRQAKSSCNVPVGCRATSRQAKTLSIALRAWPLLTVQLAQRADSACTVVSARWKAVQKQTWECLACSDTQLEESLCVHFDHLLKCGHAARAIGRPAIVPARRCLLHRCASYASVQVSDATAA